MKVQFVIKPMRLFRLLCFFFLLAFMVLLIGQAWYFPLPGFDPVRFDYNIQFIMGLLASLSFSLGLLLIAQEG